jgi:two-component system response regulator NreC
MSSSGDGQSHKFKVVLVDDHEVVRAGLRAVIDSDSQLQVVGCFGHDTVGADVVTALDPNVVVFDINIPGVDSFDLALQVKKLKPSTKVLFLTGFATDSNIERALASGGSGFLTKNDSMPSLVQAIFHVMKNADPFISQEVQSRLVAKTKSSEAGNGLSSRRSLLSPREVEVLCYVAKGQSAKQIAQTLNISAKTVERHKSNIMTKLHLHTQVDLTRYAIREGMIPA